MRRLYHISRPNVIFVLMMTFVVAIITFVSLRGMPVAEAVDTTADYIYLSDITNSAAITKSVGWGSLGLDKGSDGKKISLRVEGSTVTFDKGIFAHATSTLVYDLADYADYAYFTAYVGISTTAGSGNGVKFSIYTSNDKKNWTKVNCGLPNVTAQGSNATFVKVDISNARYLKLYADSNGGTGSDHSSYGDAKIIKAGYTDNVTKTPDEYDELIRQKLAENGGEVNDEIELLTLQRDFVKNFGQYQLKQLLTSDQKYQDAFNWLFNDLDNLRLYTMGGKPDGNYKSSLTVLADLLEAHAEDLNNDDISLQGVRYGDIFKKMMLTLSLTHSRAVYFWSYGTGSDPYGILSRPVLRYEIYKDMLLENKLDTMFDTLEIEEMRYVMAAQINDDEIKWARDFAMTKGDKRFSGYNYMSYVNISPTKYRQAAYFDPNFNAYNRNYKITQPDGTVKTLDDYGVKRVAFYPRLWTVMENGGVCWQISNVGTVMTNAQGRPSMLTGQPSHSSYIILSRDSQGRGKWTIWNDVGGWETLNHSAYNGTRGSFVNRLMIGWGNDTSYASGYTATYILLAQAAIDDYANFAKAEVHVKLANSMNTVADKVAEYEKALNIQSLNWDAWMGMLNTYKSDSTKTAKDYYELAVKAADALAYYPHPMYDYLRLIGNVVATKPDSVGYSAAITKLSDSTLRNKAMNATFANTAHYAEAKRMAKYFLGKLDTTVATFSFDGADAGVLKLAAKYENSADVAFDYKLSSSDNWSSPYVQGKSVKLAAEEIAKINSTDNIQVHIIGMNYNPENIFTINISSGSALSTIYANDLENRLIGNLDGAEWRMDDESEWHLYDANNAPDLTGDKIIHVRRAATGTTTAGPEQTFTFTTDFTDGDTKVYIPISNLTISGFSSEHVDTSKKLYEYANYAIDGNLYTHWHTDHTKSNEGKYIIIELAQERYVSRFEYVPVPNYVYGIIKNAVIYTSRDGETWAEAATISNWANDYSWKSVDFSTEKPVKYVKLQVIDNYDYVQRAGANYFVSAAMLNLYENRNRARLPQMVLEYSTLDPTNQDVMVTLINAEEDNLPVTITNNNGENTYTFSENGEFTFEISDGERTGAVTARVDWIDRDVPTADVNYRESTITNVQEDEYHAKGTVQSVVATINFTKPVTLTNEELTPVYKAITDEGTGLERKVVERYVFANGETIERADDGTLSHTFTHNHDFTLYFVDAAGNTGEIVVAVDSLSVTDGRDDESHFPVVTPPADVDEPADEPDDNGDEPDDNGDEPGDNGDNSGDNNGDNPGGVIGGNAGDNDDGASNSGFDINDDASSNEIASNETGGSSNAAGSVISGNASNTANAGGEVASNGSTMNDSAANDSDETYTVTSNDGLVNATFGSTVDTPSDVTDIIIPVTAIGATGIASILLIARARLARLQIRR